MNRAAMRAVLREPAVLIFILVLLACLTGDFFLAQNAYLDSDSIQTFTQLHAVRAGNPFLKGWVLTSDNFYFTDLILMTGLSYVTGVSLKLIYLAPFVTYCLLLAGAMLLVARAGRAARTREETCIRQIVLLFLIGVPYGPWQSFLLNSAFHTGTIALCLWALLCIEPLLQGRSFHYWRLLPFGLLVFAVAASDPMAEIFFTMPLLLTFLLKAWVRQTFGAELAALGCILLAAGLGSCFPPFMAAHGGFSITSDFTMEFVPFQDLQKNIFATLGALQLLFTARPSTLTDLPVYQLIGVTRLITGIGGLALVLLALVRFPSRPQSEIPLFCALGALTLIVASMLSLKMFQSIAEGLFFPGPATHYLAPAYIYIAIGAAIESSGLFPARPRLFSRKAVLSCGAAFMAPFFLGAIQASARAAQDPPAYRLARQMPLTEWLTAHHFTYGIGPYWTVRMVEGLSIGKIRTFPVLDFNGKIIPSFWNCDATLWQRMNPPQFVVLPVQDKNADFPINLPDVIAAYGKPLAAYDLGAYLVLQLAPLQD